MFTEEFKKEYAKQENLFVKNMDKENIREINDVLDLT